MFRYRYDVINSVVNPDPNCLLQSGYDFLRDPVPGKVLDPTPIISNFLDNFKKTGTGTGTVPKK